MGGCTAEASDAIGEHANYLLTEFERIRTRLCALAAGFRQDGAPVHHSGKGLFIADGEIDGILARPIALRAGPTASDASADGRDEDAAAGNHSPLHILRREFELNRFDCDVIMVCLLVHLFPEYAKVVAWLQDDMTRKRPGIDLLLRLADGTDDLMLRRRLLPGGPLVDHGLLVPAIDPMTARRGDDGYFELDPRILSFLLGGEAIDVRLATMASLVDTGESETPDAIADELAERIIALITEERSDNWLVHCPRWEEGCTRAVARRAARCRRRLLSVTLNSLASDDIASVAGLVEKVMREAKLSQAIVLWRDLPAAPEALVRAFFDAVDGRLPLSVIAGAEGLEIAPALPRTRFIRHPITPPNNESRQAAWRRATAALPLSPLIDGDSAFFALATNFRFTPDHIARAARLAHDRACWRGRPIEQSDLVEACRDMSASRLGALAQRVTTACGWDDLVLPADRLEQLREICDQARLRDTIYETWNFKSRIPYGRGLSVLFAGPSGTGKTLAAAVMANQLQLALYRIDLSNIVSKYIGETEKNLARIFSEAEGSNAILFFDEADALFGKRTEVKDAHDRYANLEVSYLLQKMEEYEGIVILASNFRRNMDDAFVRRIRFAVDFPMPGRAERLEIWRRIWPAAAPRADDLDLEFLADNLEIAGGSIRNIALSAAFLAAAAGESIDMRHVLHAARREFQKMGKVLTKEESGNFRLAVNRKD